jgi:hypothetical protein
MQKQKKKKAVMPHFSNVDLDIVSTSKSKLDLLAIEMGRRVTILHAGPVRNRHLLVLESSRQHSGPDDAINALCSEIERLSPTARRIWDGASKEFDVGCELRHSERMSRFSLRLDTLQRLASLGATLAATFYPLRDT